MPNQTLGYNSFFEASRLQMGLGHFAVARVISEHKGAYDVKNEEGEYLAKIRGRHMHEAETREDYPAVGDWVAITVLGDGQAVIEEILPRQSVMKRTRGDKTRKGMNSDIQVIASNIDIAFVVQSVGRDYSLNRYERYFAIAQNGGIKPVIVLNKIDQISAEELEEKLAELRARFPEVYIVKTSAVSGDGMDELKEIILPGKTYCFLGSSGVGKSSIINMLLGRNMLKTNEIDVSADRGKHTTTARQMYFLPNGGIVIDNPGMREVGIGESGQGMDDVFSEIAALAANCKYSDCTHAREPGCAVLKAVKAGQLDEEKYENYLALKKEADFMEMSDLERREKDRRFGKMVKEVKEGMKKNGN